MSGVDVLMGSAVEEASNVVQSYMEATHEILNSMLPPIIDRASELDELDNQLDQLIHQREQANRVAHVVHFGPFIHTD